jgi:4-hydroxy-2-oxoheptanedioate aldolase
VTIGEFANPLRRIWSDGGTAANARLACPSILSAKALASADWDSVTVDMQHGTADHAALPARLPCRAPEASADFLFWAPAALRPVRQR